MEKEEASAKKGPSLEKLMEQHAADAKNVSTVPTSSAFVIRCDGHGFSRFTHRAFKTTWPIDVNFVDAMQQTALLTAEKFQAHHFLVFSDEMSFAWLPSARTPPTQHPFGGKRDKLCSLMASFISVTFNEILGRLISGDPECDKKYSDATQRLICYDRSQIFDSRLALVSNDVQDISKYFLWRSMGCFRNNVHGYYMKHGLGKADSVSTEDRILALRQKAKFEWNDVPQRIKHGTFGSTREDINEICLFTVDLLALTHDERMSIFMSRSLPPEICSSIKLTFL